MQMVVVGDVGNTPHSTGFGRVDYPFRIGMFEVTHVEYAEFLNAVARDDTYQLYLPEMGYDGLGGRIVRHGTPGDYRYESVLSELPIPAVGITMAHALRFANWMHNGQPTGPQGPETTEDGAYTVTAEMFVHNHWTRNPGARYFLPSMDEWFKAAYYKGGGTDAGYWEYPTQSDIVPVSELPPGGVNSAAIGPVEHSQPSPGLQLVGSYHLSPGPYGTFDQAGNVVEWTDSRAFENTRYLVGGAYDIRGESSARVVSATGANTNSGDIRPDFPGFFRLDTGFRMASVPEPQAIVPMVWVAVGGFLLARRVDVAAKVPKAQT
jgi:formylglycine-generating enzyme required for sulfatase activity